MKRGQISIFIVVAVIVLAGGFAVYYVSSKSSGLDRRFSSDANIQSQFDSIKDSILSCMNSVSKDSLDEIGLHGGYYQKPEKYLEINGTFIAYYYQEGNSLMPLKSKIEIELGKYADDNLGSCIKKISSEGFTINYNKAKTKATINIDNVKFSIDSSVSINREDNNVVLELKKAPVVINSKLYDIIYVANNITKGHDKNERLCISCIGNLAVEKKLVVNVFDISSTDSLFIISENQTTSEYYSFEFINKYKNADEEQKNAPPLPNAPK